MSECVIITGGAGFIGSNLAEAVGERTIVIDSLHTGSPQNLSGVLCEFYEWDSSQIGKLPYCKPTVIYHLGIPSSSPMYTDSRDRITNAVAGAVSVFDYAVKTGAKVVFASTSSVYNGLPPPHREDQTPKVSDFYTEARIAMERLAEVYNRLYGMRYAAMRFFSVYGPKERFKGRYANLVSQFIWNGQAKIYGDGEQARDFIHVSDVVAALRLAGASDRNGVFNVGTGVATTLNELALKLRVPIEHVPNPVKNYVPMTQADTAKSATELGFRAKVSLDEGIDRLNNTR